MQAKGVPPLKPVLERLTAIQASWRHTGEAANTIWEHLNHLLYYNERVLERIKGGTPIYPASRAYARCFPP
ncbi:DinB family protein [Paenibacillus elgii]|uniref:DinB family protein n=1 Tax=Paenibacillus elgii TaxID=189691 RepID=UPI0013D0C35A|nr:DinB family protein [Paenibacillus elgii]